MIFTLTDAPSIAWDASNGSAYELTLTGDHALETPTNMTAGEMYVLLLKQDGTGNRKLSLAASYKMPLSTPPATSTVPYAVDVLTFISDGSSMILIGITKDVGTALAAPSALVAADSVGGVDLSWTDNSSDETGFVIEYLNDPILNDWGTLAEVGAGVTTYRDVQAPGEYTYRVRAKRYDVRSQPTAPATGNSLE
jgi:hypothetical protein